MKKLAVIIHARQKSTRCPNKHLRPINDSGDTLLDIALKNVRDLNNVEEKYLAAAEDEIKDRYVPGVPILHREHASVAPGNAHHSVMYKHLNNVNSEYICNYNPCQPFLNIKKLQTVIDWFKQSKYESAITVAREKNFFWNNDLTPANFKVNDRLSTTSGPSLLKATHSLVFYKKEYMLNNWELFSNAAEDPYPYLIDWPEEELIDVDTELDFKLVEKIHEVRNRH
jgi:CMP-N-acetylneuraminic acid synthetase